MIDPLAILREDTYSNEEVNEMTGRMIREQYIAEQEEVVEESNPQPV